MRHLGLFSCVAKVLVCLAGFSPAQTPSYTLSPKSVMANKAFTLQVLSSAYDSCHYSFTHTALAVNNGTITASFVPVNDTACSAVVHPFGPAYLSSGLAAGKYAVYAEMELACQFTPPLCPSLAVLAPVFVDTLNVMMASSVLWRQMRMLPAPLRLDSWGLVRGYWLNGRKAR